MSAIEKWRGNLPARKSTGSQLTPRVRTELERWLGPPERPPAPRAVQQVEIVAPRPQRVHSALYGSEPPDIFLEREGAVIDLPRRCAVHKLLWCARYVFHHGHFRYHGGIDPEQTHTGQYGPEMLRHLPPSFRAAKEICPHCGGRTRTGCTGAVQCGDCGQFYCYGNTTEDSYSSCPCCGSSGYAELRNIQYNGVIPWRGGLR